MIATRTKSVVSKCDRDFWLTRPLLHTGRDLCHIRIFDRERGHYSVMEFLIVAGVRLDPFNCDPKRLQRLN